MGKNSFVTMFRAIVSVVCYYTGLWHVIFIIHRLVTGKYVLAVFTYHRVIEATKADQYLVDYDRGLDGDAFAAQIEVLCRCFEVVTLDDFLAIVTGEAPLEGNTALLTFDDADTDFIRAALPKLEEKAHSATIFVPIMFVDSRERFWHLRVSNVMSNMSPQAWTTIQAGTGNFPEPIREIALSGSLRAVLVTDWPGRLRSSID